MVSFNNFLVVTLFPGSYLLFVVILICKGSSVSALKSTSRSQKKVCRIFVENKYDRKYIRDILDFFLEGIPFIYKIT